MSNVSGTAGAVSWNLNDDEEDNKEDGKAGVNKLDDAISSRLTKQEKWTNEIKKVTEHADNPRRKAKGGMITKWESKWS